MVCMKIDEGRAMPVSSKNLAAGMILPRATPARSGTRHSISVTLRAAAHLRAWATSVSGLEVLGRAEDTVEVVFADSARDLDFLAMGRLQVNGRSGDGRTLGAGD